MKGLGRSLLLGKLLLSALAVSSCAFAHGVIPATSTPEREARYYHTQDVANAAASVVVDEAARLIFKGPRQCADTVWSPVYGNRWVGTTCSNWGPVARFGTVLLLGGLYRATSKDYRESGWLFNVGGAVGWEIIRCFFSAGCKVPRR